jgi:hypothetical protein
MARLLSFWFVVAVLWICRTISSHSSYGPPPHAIYYWEGTNFMAAWPQECGTMLAAPSATGPWTTLTNSSPYKIPIWSGWMQFYRFGFPLYGGTNSCSEVLPSP